ncbi:sensor histidine kinase [Streptomyces olivochromogenes]|uniref:sensor histidine kinase n=1 Tax=Streptomyces olivochromogenes TaxID=1963 RepID=UPI001F3C10ED|nr:sensor histidine kinase [Streptomyces olivochromogenes]MCF3131912.1 sensor histidine kinase [Streptomyces olivochromogenes]
MTLPAATKRPRHATGRVTGRAPRKTTTTDATLSALAVGYALVVYFVVDTGPDVPGARPGMDWLFISWVSADVVAGAAILTRRRWPVLLALAAATASFVTGSVMTVPIAFYTLISQRRYPWAVAAAVAVCASQLRDFIEVCYDPRIGLPLTVVRGFEEVVVRQMMPFVIVPVLVAVTVREHRQRIASLRTHAARLQREQELVAQNAVLTERSRIAREMHDSVTHYVGLIILRAGVLEVTAGREPATGQTAQLIGELGRRAMQELRDLLQVLRADATGPRPALSRAGEEPFEPDLARLLGTAQEAGMRVSWRVDPRIAECDPSLRQGLYRIVQEALSNAGRHAPGAEVDVAATAEGEVLKLTVRNGRAERTDGHPSATGSGGLGLRGMRERARSLGGEVTTTSTPQGGFLVQALIPLRRLSGAGHP